MKRLSLFLLTIAMTQGWCDSISLLNNSKYTLSATIFDANGNVGGEYVLGPRDAWDWSDDYDQFGMESPLPFTSPYTVKWYCTRGTLYGVCENVGSGDLVSAQDCGGDQECSGNGGDY